MIQNPIDRMDRWGLDFPKRVTGWWLTRGLVAGCRCPSSASKTSRGAEVKSRVSTFHLGKYGGGLKRVRYDPEAVASVGALTPMARLGCRMPSIKQWRSFSFLWNVLSLSLSLSRCHLSSDSRCISRENVLSLRIVRKAVQCALGPMWCAKRNLKPYRIRGELRGQL